MSQSRSGFGRAAAGLLLAGLALGSAACARQASAEYFMDEGAPRPAPMVADALMEAAPAQAPTAARAVSPSVQDKDAAGGAPALPAGDVGDAVPVDGAANADRKLVKTAFLRLKVEDLAAAQAAAERLVADLGGYIASAASSEESANLSLRVPQADFDRALAGLAPLGSLQYRSVSAEDVTLQFYDLEGRLATKRDLMDTFRGYLRRSQTMKDILEVESRLADLQNEIDSLGGQFRHLSDRIDYATIDLELVLPASYAPYEEPGLGERLADLLQGMGRFLVGLAVGIVAVALYGIPLLALLALAWWLLFGKVGLLVKLFRLVARPRGDKPPRPDKPQH